MKAIKRVMRTFPMGLVLGCLIIAQLSASPLTRPVPPRPADHSQANTEPSNDANADAMTRTNIDVSTDARQSPQDNPFQNLNATLQRLRDEYTRIVAKFNALRFDCKSNMRIRVNDAIADALKWKHTVDVLGLLEQITLADLQPSEKELIIRDRLGRQGLTGEALEARVHAFNLNDLGAITDSESRLVRANRLRQRGLTAQQIAEVLSGDEAITRELRPMYENLDRLTWESLKNAYNKAYECCLCSAQDFLPSMMSTLFHEMTLISESEAVKVGSIEKNEECLRRVQEKAGGAGWRGTITYESKYKSKGSAQKGNNINYWDEESSYDATIQLDGKVDQNGVPIAKLTATASETKINSGKGTVGCYRITQQQHEVKGAAEDDKAGVKVSTNFRPGFYSIYYTLTDVKAAGESRVTSKVGGTCNNPFNKPLDQTEPVSDYSVDSGPYVEIEGRVDPENPDSLVGTKTVTVPGKSGGERKITVTWNLLYCKKG
ncbi:MAG TPA: hypothetical protein VLQ90_04980 [Pyrinomonadaceae bacterium]|nr:hypothetical protein [Pyrinomonadaceae bacterium]